MCAHWLLVMTGTAAPSKQRHFGLRAGRDQQPRAVQAAFLYRLRDTGEHDHLAVTLQPVQVIRQHRLVGLGMPWSSACSTCGITSACDQVVQVAPVFAAVVGRVGAHDNGPIRANLIGGLPQGIEEHTLQIQRPGRKSPDQFLAGTLVEIGFDGKGQERAVALGVTEAFLETNAPRPLPVAHRSGGSWGWACRRCGRWWDSAARCWKGR